MQTTDGSLLSVAERILDARQNIAMAPVRRKQSINEENTGVLYVSIIPIAKIAESIYAGHLKCLADSIRFILWMLKKAPREKK